MFEAQQQTGYWTAQIQVPQLNATVAANFQRAFSEAVASFKGPVILNLEAVNFMDSSGLAAIVFCFKSLVLRKELLLCCVHERVKKSLHIAKMDHVLEMFPSQQDAITFLAKSHQSDA